MKFALINEQRREAQPGLSGICPVCRNPVVAKCGDIRVNHWAHSAGSNCDNWWEIETGWHRNWKNKFPAAWQEVVHTSKKTGKHIADIKTDQGWVIEFQHSFVSPEEQKSREQFYRNLIWIVNGNRRDFDRKHFFRLWKDSETTDKNLNMRKISLKADCALLKDWACRHAPVLFDFSGNPCGSDDEQLKLFNSKNSFNPVNENLWLLVKAENEQAYIMPIPRKKFIDFHGPESGYKRKDFAKLIKYLKTENINKSRHLRLLLPIIQDLNRTANSCE